VSGERWFVVTCRIPRGMDRNLQASVAGRAITISSSDGFRHVFDLPRGTGVDQVTWQVYGDVLELRAPLRSAP
jgi:hypothetical protein